MNVNNLIKSIKLSAIQPELYDKHEDLYDLLQALNTAYKDDSREEMLSLLPQIATQIRVGETRVSSVTQRVEHLLAFTTAGVKLWAGVSLEDESVWVSPDANPTDFTNFTASEWAAVMAAASEEWK